MVEVFFKATPNPQAMKFVVTQQIAERQAQFFKREECLSSPLAAKLFGFPWLKSVFIGPNFVTLTKHDWVEWKLLTTPLCKLIGEHINQGEAVLLDPVSVSTPYASVPHTSAPHASTDSPSSSTTPMGAANRQPITGAQNDVRNGVQNGAHAQPEKNASSSSNTSPSGDEKNQNTSSPTLLEQQVQQVLMHEVRPALQSDGGDVEFVRLQDARLYIRLQGACVGCPSASITLKSGIENHMRQRFSQINEVVAL